jgi:hypothetical protein
MTNTVGSDFLEPAHRGVVLLILIAMAAWMRRLRR